MPAGRLRARREPHVELRPLAVGDPVPALSGSCGSWRRRSSSTRCWPRSCAAGGAFKVRRGEGDLEAMRDGRRARARGRDRGHVPGGHAADEGAARRSARRGRTPARPGSRSTAGVPLVPGRDRRHRPAQPARAAAVAYGEPIDLSDLEGQDIKRALPSRDRAADGDDRRAEGDAVKPLLVIDGDSLAHRAYHAMPKSIRAGNGVSSASRTCCCASGRPSSRAPCSSAGTRSRCRPTGTRSSSRYQSGRVFEESLLEQLPLLPELVARDRLRGREGRRLRGRRLPRRRGRASRRQRGGEALVATSDRDSFQLASDRTTILQPVRGVSELARIGPAEVRERYGVEPAQVPDFIALRGDPSDKLPGARGVGPKKAADVLREYGSLEAALEAGRFAAEAEDLAPLPANRDGGRLRPAPSPRRPDTHVGGGVRSLERLGPERPRRPAGRSWAERSELVSHPALAAAPPDGTAPSSRGQRLRGAAGRLRGRCEGRAGLA